MCYNSVNNLIKYFMNKIKMKIILVAVFLLIITGGVFLYKNIKTGGTATLSWNKGQDADLAGYKIYYGTSPRKDNCPKESGYNNYIDIDNSPSYIIKNLKKGKTYYFSVSSYDKSGNESCFAEEVKKSIPYLKFK